MRNLFLRNLVFLFVLIISCNSAKNWNEVKNENTVLAYEEFLANNPETEHKDSVLLLITELDWLFAKNAHSIVALDSFGIKYPEDEVFVDSINSLKDDLIYDEIMPEHKIEAYQKFIDDYPENNNLYKAKREIEKLKWNEVKKNNKSKEIAEFVLEHGAKYLDSIDVKFKLKDFMGYAVSFEANEKDSLSDTYEKVTLNFNRNKTLTGIYEGFREEFNNSAAWSGELRGEFDEYGLYAVENRLTDFSDAYEFETEPWDAFNLFFEEEDGVLTREPRIYKVVDIAEIEE